jgi:hypothetical protein
MTDKRNEIARAICDSESFMWLMVGSNHQELQLKNLRSAWRQYTEVGGGYGKGAAPHRRSGPGRCECGYSAYLAGGFFPDYHQMLMDHLARNK